MPGHSKGITDEDGIPQNMQDLTRLKNWGDGTRLLRLWVLHVCSQSSSVRKLEVGWQDGLIPLTVTPVIQRIGIGNCIVDLVNFINIQALPDVL